MLDQFLTLTELRNRLRISKATWSRMQSRGDIPTLVRLGRRVLASERAVEAWLAGKTFAPVPTVAP